MMKARTLSVLLVAAFLLAFASPAYAAETAQSTLDIRIKAGSTQMKVSGKAVTIKAPYQSGGTTMVPMAVFTKGLGAKLTLKNNKIITLTSGSKKVVLTIGSKAATANGKKLTLAVAPVNKKGLTYAPVKVVESFGAKITTDASTKEIRIVVSAPAADKPGDGGSVIDSDAGKSKIGDSHFQWSMNYPTGLVQDFQSEEGDTLIFRDVKKEYYLGIFVEDAKDPLSSDDMRENLYSYTSGDETVVDKQTVAGSEWSYEKISTKDKSGFYYEMRGYQLNGYFYAVIFGKKASSLADLRKYTGIVDSFKPKFERGDTTLKDLAKVFSDTKVLKNEDYGLTVPLPKGWTADEYMKNPAFSSADEDAYLSMEVSSLVAGDTVGAWIDRRMKRYEQSFVTEYRKAPEQSDVTWNGIPAKMVKLSYSMDTKSWSDEYEIFAVQGNYRYYTEFAYPVSKKDTYGSLINTILSDMKVDFKKIENNFGYIPDDTDMQDLTLTTTKTSKTYGYSIQVPKHWAVYGDGLERSLANFSFSGGNLSVMVFDDMPDAQSLIDEARSEASKTASDSSNFKIIQDSMTTFAGQSAQKFVVEDNRNLSKAPNRDTAYIFAYNGKVYIVEGIYYLANGTDFVKQQLEAAMNSFKLNG